MKGIAKIIIAIFIFSTCKPPQIANAPTKPHASFTFSKSKQQVLNILDSIILNSQFFFKEDAGEPDHIFLNLKDKNDTVRFALFYKDRDIHKAASSDSSTFFVMSIGKYYNRKSDETIIYPKMDSLQKKAYLNKLDSFIMTPLKQQINKIQ